MSRALTVVAALVICAAAPTGAVAAPAWLSPQSLSAAGAAAVDPQVAVDAQGSAVAVWTRFDGTKYRVQAALRPAGGTFGAAQDLSAAGQDAFDQQVAVDGQGNAIAVWYRSDGTKYRVQAAARPAGGTFGASQNLSAAGQDAFGQQVAVDGQGNAIAVWRRFDGSHYRVQAAVRPAGGSFGAAQDLSAAGQGANNPQVAVDAQGNAIAVWSRSDGAKWRVQAAMRPAGGTFGGPQDLSAPGQDAFDPQVAVDAQGNAVAVWHRYDGSHQRVQAAVRPAGGTFGAPQDLSAAGQNGDTAQVAMDAPGNAIAVWERYDGAKYRVQAAMRPAGGTFGAPQNLSAAGQDAHYAQVAVNAVGNAVAVWQRYDGANSRAQAAVRPAGGTFGAPQDLSAAGQDANAPQVAVDAQGNAIAVWYRSDGTNARVQAAGHDAAGPQLRALQVPGAAQAGQAFSVSVSPLDVWSTVAGTGWSFSDGTSVNGASATHAFATAGSYTATVTSTDTLGNASTAARTITVTAAPAAPSPGGGGSSEVPGTEPTPEPAKIRVLRNGIRKGYLDLRLQITSLATGSIGLVYHSAGKKTRFSVDIPRARAAGRPRAHAAETAWNVRRRLPRSQRRTTTGIVTLTYKGNQRVRPDDVRLRAASGRARLVRKTSRISNGRLIVDGTISRRAAGVVRIRMGYVAGDGSLKFLRYHARIRSKKGSRVKHWRLNESLPADAARAGGDLSIQFTGYRPRRIRGEQTTKQVIP